MNLKTQRTSTAKNLILLLFFLSLGLCAEDSKIEELQVTREDEDNGKSIFTVFIRPGETMRLDKIEYLVPYHQSFPFEDSRGNSYTKTHEPAVFKYTRQKVKLVEDLDDHVNFRVPVSFGRLKVIYGNLTFHPDYPILIPQIKIVAYNRGNVVWEHVAKINVEYIRDKETKTLVENLGKKKIQVSDE
ncbi:MAG: hypothetical protein JW808_12145 [Victivallales bacterium]|nr:hypothetical protein [Victivallales bacterium]